MKHSGFSVTRLLFAAVALGVAAHSLPILAQGGTAATSRMLPVDAIRSNDCTGEQVQLSGTIHLVSQLQADGTVVGHFNYQGVTGAGLTSGTTFRATTVDNFILRPPFPTDITSVRTFQLLGPGSGNNLLVHITTHVTVNANGEVTATVDSLRMVCR